jgi:uncharacterized SAM-binding protein YcdF (DUF218 family)
LGVIEAVSRYALDPASIAIALLLAALIAGERRTLARGLTAAAFLLLAAFVLLPFDMLLARPLENQYPRPPLPRHIDGILVLSSSLSPALFADRGALDDSSDSLQRMTAAVVLARQFPGAKLVYSGTTADSAAASAAERRAAELIFGNLGLAPQRVIYEGRSRNSYENFVFTRRIVRPKPGETWILVTSAMHMPRSMAIANRLGWKMVPWPSSYTSTARLQPRPFEFPGQSFLIADQALHEWIGLLVYRIEGRL